MAQCKQCGAKTIWAEHIKTGKPMMFDSPPKEQLWIVRSVETDENEWGNKRVAEPVSLYVIHLETCTAREQREPGNDAGF